MLRSSIIVLAGMIALHFSPANAQGSVRTSAGPMLIVPMATGLVEPWGIGFLPDGSFLVTERGGTLKLFSGAAAEPTLVDGLPDVHVEGQGGLLGIMIPRNFSESREVWVSFALLENDQAVTALGRGRLSEDGTGLVGFETVFAAPPAGVGGNHFGSRVVEAPDGTIFLTIGDRGTGPAGMEAQDLRLAAGKIVHLNRDGSPASGIEGALPGVYSMGHRNPQGAALDLEGNLWAVEHGAQGGDELNRIELGLNYGWPVIAYGVQYGGGRIGVGQQLEGMEQPVHYWDPSIAPSGLMFYSGKLVPEWRGDVFTGSLKFDFISRLDPDRRYAEEEIRAAETGRVRDVVEAPDGSIWFLSVHNGAAYRLAPME